MTYANSGSRTWFVRRTFDEADNLVVYEQKSVQKHDGATKYLYRVEQSFEGGRIVSRRILRHNGGIVRTDWTWNADGKLILAQRRLADGDAKVAAAAMWTYDQAGRPISVKRTIHGNVLMSARWSWQGNGQLRARDVTINKGVGAIPGGRLDSYDMPSGMSPGTCYGCGYYGGGDPARLWEDAVMRVEDGCRTLPVAIGHGYPEPDYALADPEDAQMSKHVYGGYYGYYGYGYYGYYGYYGGGGRHATHIGVGGNWDALALLTKHSTVRMAIGYDGAGRMVNETLALSGKDGETLGAAWQRRRTFENDALTVDEVRKNGLPMRALEFKRDAMGRLIRRGLVVAGTELEYDVFERNGAGMPVVRERFGQMSPWKHLGPHAKVETAPAPRKMMRLERAWDERGQLTMARVETAHSGQIAHTTRWAWDDGGRIVGRSLANDKGGITQLQTWRFDDAGREVMRTHWYASSKSSHGWFQATTYNGSGQRTKTIRGQDPAKAASWLETRSYACPADAP